MSLHPQPRAGARLLELLAHVPSPENWHVTVMRRESWAGTSRDAIEHAMATGLNRFASHVVEAEPE